MEAWSIRRQFAFSGNSSEKKPFFCYIKFIEYRIRLLVNFYSGVYRINIFLQKLTCLYHFSARKEAKINNFALKNSNIIIKELIWKRKDNFL